MLRLRADSTADVHRFVRRVTETEVAWYLAAGAGLAYCCSNDVQDHNGAPADVILLFSDAAYARRVRQRHFPEFQPTQVSLFNLIYRWLPGMGDDCALAGVIWTGDLIGMELNPKILREMIEAAMPQMQLPDI